MSQKFLLIKLRHHGDVLLTTPVADALKQAYPDCIIDMLVYAETTDIIQDNSQINRIFVVDRQWKKQGVLSQVKHEVALFRDLKAQNYDYAINFSDQWRAAVLAKCCARHAISYHFSKRDNAMWRFCHDMLVDDWGKDNHIVQAHLQALDVFRLPENITPRVRMQVADDTQNSLYQKLHQCGWQGEKYVLIHPGSRWLFKCWDDDKMAQLVQKLLDSGQNVVLTAAPDPREAQMLQFILERVNIPSNVHLWTLSGCLNLRELAAAINEATLFIGVDSVPMHMAAALDKPQVALFGASHVFRWRPYSDQATVIWAGDYGDLPHPDSVDTRDETRLLSSICVQTVWQAVEQKLKEYHV